MIRELWSRHMDSRRALSLALLVVAYGLLVLALAVDPGVITAGSVDPRWIVWSAPAFIGTAWGGYVSQRRTGAGTSTRRTLAQGGLMFLLSFGLFVLASLVKPIVVSNPTFGGDAWAGLLAVGLVVGATSGVLWERDRRRRRTAAFLLAAVGLIIAGFAGLRAGGPWTPIGAAVLIMGVLGVAAAALQAISNLVREPTTPATWPPAG